MKKFQNILSKIFIAFLLICSIVVLAVSSIKLYGYNKERVENQKLTKQLISENSSDHKLPITVDFEKLKNENGDIIAWIYCEGTPLNYPIAQAEDNSFYLHRKINGEYSFSGTLFADCLNNGDFSDNNTIIYGHNMKNDTMFGTLLDYRKQEFYDEHPEMYLLTPDKDFKLKLVAGVYENSKSSIYKLPLEYEEKENFIFGILKKSTFETDYIFSDNDRFVMLSTCINEENDARFVLVGVLEEL